jgi:hypothetical protein
MAFLGYTILATEGFLHEVSVINYRVKTFISKPCIQVVVKEGVGGKRYDFFKGDFELMEIVHEEEVRAAKLFEGQFSNNLMAA